MTDEDASPIPPVPTSGTAAPRCALVVDADLAPGLAANAAVLALSLGARVPGLVGADLVDADGGIHVGLFPRGLPVLAASRAQLAVLRAAAVEAGVFVVDFPAAGQQTTDYAQLGEQVAQVAASEVDYIGVGVCGGGRAVRRLTGALSLLR